MGNNEHQSEALEPNSLDQILYAMNEAGEFQIAVLATMDGLPIATAPPGYDTSTAAAMVALLQKVSKEARDELGMAKVDEVTIHDDDRIRLVCRHFAVGGEGLILAVIVPPGSYYRRATNRAVRQIKQLLS